MDKKFKSCDRKQLFLLPPSVMNWLPQGHLAYFIIDVVEQLDLSDIYSVYERIDVGNHPMIQL